MKKEKRNNYKFWHSPIALVVLFFILIFFSYSMIDLIKKEKETSEIKELTLDEINTLEEKKTSLSNDILKLKTEEGREEIIREKYPVVKEGEKMVTIVDEEINDSSGQSGKVNHGFWNWVKRIFDN